MFDIGINFLTIDLTAVSHLLVSELKEVTIDNIWRIIFENFEKISFVLRVSLFAELTECHEIFTIDTMV